MKHLPFAEQQAIRLRAVPLFEEGLSNAEIARRLGVSRKSVTTWHQRFRASGSEGVLMKTPGPKSALTPEQWEPIIQALLAGPQASGYDTQLWTLDRIADLIEQKTGVRYHAGHVWHLLRQLDWSCQKPERRAKERNEAAIARWKAEEWPRIKRGRWSEGPGSSS